MRLRQSWEMNSLTICVGILDSMIYVLSIILIMMDLLYMQYKETHFYISNLQNISKQRIKVITMDRLEEWRQDQPSSWILWFTIFPISKICSTKTTSVRTTTSRSSQNIFFCYLSETTVFFESSVSHDNSSNREENICLLSWSWFAFVHSTYYCKHYNANLFFYKYMKMTTCN